MHMPVTLGIDLGTSAVKTVLLADGAVIGRGEAPLVLRRLRTGWAEQDPDAWVEAASLAVQALWQNSQVDRSRVAAIGLSGQMHGAVLLARDDRPIRPAMLWNDVRASAEAEEIGAGRPDLANFAGVICVPGFTAPKLLWLRRHEPRSLEALKTLLLPKDYLRFWLTGELATDMSDAAGTWLFDQARRAWSPEIADYLSIDSAILPQLHESPEIAGNLRDSAAIALGLAPGLPVVAGAGDAAAGGLGLGMTEDQDAFISLGTSGQFFVATDRYRPAIDDVIHAFAHGLPERWFQMGVTMNAASALEWWSRVCGVTPAALAKEAAGRQVIANSSFFFPYLTGERTPHNDPTPAGGFIGLATQSSRAEMTGAVMEGVAFTLADVMDAMCKVGTAPLKIGLIGGGARDSTWAQTIADVLAIPVERYSHGDIAPALGAARLALAGIAGSTAGAFGKSPVIERFDPDRVRGALFADRFERWRESFQALRRLHHRSGVPAAE
jgi:xylulokinase